jgi:hypothetical protein
MRNSIISALILILVSVSAVPAQKNKYEAVGFYNLDNFFDTIKDTRHEDDDYLPYGIKRWTKVRYLQKLEHMAFAISQIGTKDVPHGLAALGVCEVENRRVLEDLIMTPPLREQQWGIVHYDSPDRQGLDVALLYQRNRFQVISSIPVPLRIAGKPKFRTRDQLLVTGRLGGEIVHLIVAHYPARGTCERCSQYQRVAAAMLTLSIVKYVQDKDPHAKIIIMGDFNDNPSSYSVADALGAKSSISQTRAGMLFNTSYPLYNDGGRSTIYRRQWCLFDQMIVSHSLLQGSCKGLCLYESTIFNVPFFVDKYTKGRPAHTLARGFSTHFPIYLLFLNENAARSKKGLTLSRPQREVTTNEWTRDTSYVRYVYGRVTEVTFRKKK